jgi:hypothetical protein
MTYSTIFTNAITKRDIQEQKPRQFSNGATGWESVKVGEEEVIFNVAIDKEQLAQMARIAARNKSQKCKDGAVLVEVVTRRRL